MPKNLLGFVTVLGNGKFAIACTSSGSGCVPSGVKFHLQLEGFGFFNVECWANGHYNFLIHFASNLF